MTETLLGGDGQVSAYLAVAQRGGVGRVTLGTGWPAWSGRL